MTLFEKKGEAIRERATEIEVHREDAMRGRVRVTAPNGEEIVIDLPRGERIHNGDFFGPSDNGTFFRVSILPEHVIKVSFRKSDKGIIENAIKLGYTLGNRHLEVLVDGEGVYLPLTLGPEKIEGIIRRTGLPVDLETVTKVISPAASGYFAGEEEEGS